METGMRLCPSIACKSCIGQTSLWLTLSLANPHFCRPSLCPTFISANSQLIWPNLPLADPYFGHRYRPKVGQLSLWPSLTLANLDFCQTSLWLTLTLANPSLWPTLTLVNPHVGRPLLWPTLPKWANPPKVSQTLIWPTLT